jgi:hypothetical protein
VSVPHGSGIGVKIAAEGDGGRLVGGLALGSCGMMEMVMTQKTRRHSNGRPEDRGGSWDLQVGRMAVAAKFRRRGVVSTCRRKYLCLSNSKRMKVMRRHKEVIMRGWMMYLGWEKKGAEACKELEA